MAERTLILLPGLDGTGVMFRPFLPFLTEDVRTVVVSYPRDQPLGYEELLPIVAEALPTEGPFVLLGESFSGPLALKVASAHPEGLQALILCASFIGNPVRWFPAQLAPLVRPWMFRLFPALKAARAILGGYSSPALRALTVEALSGLRPEVLAHRVKAVLRVDVARELTACPVPILYLAGSRDRVVRKHNLESITTLGRSVEVVEIPAPHLVLQDQPEAAAAAIGDFLERCAEAVAAPRSVER